MDSRAEILNRIAQRTGGPTLPEIPSFHQPFLGATDRFTEILQSIGGAVLNISHMDELRQFITSNYSSGERVVSCYPGVDETSLSETMKPHDLRDVSLAILRGEFGVAENGAVWITDEALPERVLPFITEHLIVVLNANDFVLSMHDAYDRIGASNYAFGTFIAGPSKTADIEQSLVLGAHGPKSMTVAIVRMI